ncbi:MAG: TIGR04282 family arsenosugar biosynthesis glycosyltransferase [Desulfobacula sp.]|nr:TIGR04282 family arsenosugar biosynthesis glycosyltransferase [Desulfobacula sp.]
MGNRAVIIFLRAPEKGHVKTRLSRSLNHDFVLDLYKSFAEDTLAAVKNQGEPHLYFWPPHKKTMLCGWLGDEYCFLPQKGDNLGQKMANAFKDVFLKDIDQALLIGTDIPQLDSGIISLGFQILETKPAVVGPSSDGGYYLMGFNKKDFSEIIFQNIHWSTPTVLDQTLTSMKQISIEPGLLPLLTDIDTLSDFERIIKDIKQGGIVGPKTRQVLLSHVN